VTHRHSQHTVCDGVSGVTEEGCHPGVPVCHVSGTGSAVREVQGVFSVFFIVERTYTTSAWRCFVRHVVSVSAASRYVLSRHRY
jgi:hypothetical protein